MVERVSGIPILQERQLSSAPLYNGNVWLCLLAQVGCLSRSQVREVMEGYRLDQPDSVQELVQRVGIDVGLKKNNFLNVLTFNYKNFLDKNFHDDKPSIFRAVMMDIYSIVAFGTATSVLEKVPVNVSSPQGSHYEEYFHPTYVGKEIADTTFRLVSMGIKDLEYQGLETLRIIPADDPLKSAIALTKPIPKAVGIREVMYRLRRVFVGA